MTQIKKLSLGEIQREMTSYRTSMSSYMKKIWLVKLTCIQYRTALWERNSLLFGPLFAGKNLVKVWILYDFSILHIAIEALISQNKKSIINFRHLRKNLHFFLYFKNRLMFKIDLSSEEQHAFLTAKKIRIY